MMLSQLFRLVVVVLPRNRLPILALLPNLGEDVLGSVLCKSSAFLALDLGGALCRPCSAVTPDCTHVLFINRVVYKLAINLYVLSFPAHLNKVIPSTSLSLV